MRGIRVGSQPSVVGVHVRAAIASWKAGSGVLGGVALLGCQPKGCPEPVDAVIVLPRAILIVVGVDLPEPAMRLDAPLDDTWRVDGWPLVRPDGPLNPASQALGTAGIVAAGLRAAHPEMLNIHTVVAVGPYAAEVFQPSTRTALNQITNTVVLHPEANTLLATAKVAQGNAQPFAVEDARMLIETLSPGSVPSVAELHAEGFPDVVSAELAAQTTHLMPRFAAPPPPMPPPLRRKPQSGGAAPPGPPAQAGTAQPGPAQPGPVQPGPVQPGPVQPGPVQPGAGQADPAQPDGKGKQARPHLPGKLRWLPIAALSLLCLLMVTGIGMAIVSGQEPAPRTGTATAQQRQQQTRPADETAVRPASVAVDGVQFTTMATNTDDQCSGHAFGALQSWLSASSCTELVRSVFKTTERDRDAAVSVAQLRFADAASARKFVDRVRKPGSGGVTDLVAEGHGWDGGPQTFDGAAFAVTSTGKQAKLTTAVWSQQPSTAGDEGLRTLAKRALRLPM